VHPILLRTSLHDQIPLLDPPKVHPSMAQRVLCSADVQVVAPAEAEVYMTRPRYGWRWVNGRLVHHPAEQAMITWLREMRRDNPAMTVNAMCTLLEKHPEFPKRDAKRWHPTMVKRIMERHGIPVKPNYYHAPGQSL
jgi:hypothetical protein